MRAPLLLATVLITACAPQPQPVKQAEAPKPLDQSHRFPKVDLVDTRLVDKELMSKPFMPGGNVARYKKDGKEYELFLAKLPSPVYAASLLVDWRKALKDAKLNPSYGGYFGLDGSTPTFVFAKGDWLAGVAGLSEKDADTVARPFAAALN